MDHSVPSGQVGVDSAEPKVTDASPKVINTIPYTALVLGVAMAAFIFLLMAYVVTKIHWSRRTRQENVQQASSVEQGTKPTKWWNPTLRDNIFSKIHLHHSSHLEVAEATVPTATVGKFTTQA